MPYTAFYPIPQDSIPEAYTLTCLEFVLPTI